MKPDDARSLAFFEMAADGVTDICPEFLPRVCLRDDGVPERAGDEAAFGLLLPDFKDDLVHDFTIS